MIIRTGIVGPTNTVRIITSIAEEYKDRLKMIPFIYNTPSEAKTIVENNQNNIDVWIFAGPVLYTYVINSISKQPFFFLQLDGASLTKTLVEIGYKDKKTLRNLSIDIIPSRDVYETFSDLSISYDSVYSKEYHNDTSIEDLLHFHKELVKQNKVSICLTCLYSIYEKLQDENIQSYYITPTRTNIRETITRAIQNWETNYFKESQMSVILIRIDELKKNDSISLSYDQHRLNLQLQSTIIDYAESIFGSFVNLGPDTFVIFSTRGSIQKSKIHVVDLLEQISLITDFPTNIGIGYGETALAAEANARIGLQHAKKYAAFTAFQVDVDEKIEGPLEDKHSISYGYRSNHLNGREDINLSGVTITTFNKILSIQNKKTEHYITAADIAQWLKMTERNARRILNELVEQGYAKIIGEEAPGTKGRPRKMYHIDIQNNGLSE